MGEEILVGGTSTKNACGFLEQSDAIDETERCGICMEIVIDRGVLDCCNHWFCFTCIDNWAIITNLCPLCKAQFELIRCLPVYDTLSSINGQQNSSNFGGTERDESWCIYGEKNSLSFPSYYIEEDAVACLEGDGCRIRSGITMTEEEECSSLDTSVACDSCDIWYHAVCVGFDPENTIDGSWLCPRCKASGMLKDPKSTFFQSKKSPEKDIQSWETYEDTLLKNKVSVSVADAGETAVVVSLVEGEKCGTTTQEKSEDTTPIEDKQVTDKTSVPLCCGLNGSESMKLGGVEPVVKLPDNVVSVSVCDGGTICPAVEDSNSILGQECNQMPLVAFSDEEANHADTSPGSKISFSVAKLGDTAIPTLLVEDSGFPGLKGHGQNIVKAATGESKEQEKKTCMLLDNDLSTKSLEKFHVESGKKISSHSCHVNLPVSQGEKMHSLSSADKLAIKSINVDERVLVGDSIDIANRQLGRAKRKHDMKGRDEPYPRDSILFHQGLGQTAKCNEISVKRARLCGQNEQIHHLSLNAKCGQTEVTNSRDMSGNKKKFRVDRLPNSTKKDGISLDLIDLVKGPEFAETSKMMGHTSIRKTGSENEQVSSVRMRKIMPRRMDDSETMHLVQEIRKELRAAVGHGTPGDLGKIHASDDKLLTAFKAAMNRAHEKEENSKSKISCVRASRQLLKKGTVRENLTKKLYGTGNGKRRRAWDRDWEIEFWKARCNKEKQLKKVETPDTVRELLKMSLDAWSKSPQTELRSETEATDPIFSRLYLADNSLFPRKDDIMPISAHSEPGNQLAGGHNAEAEQPKIKEIGVSEVNKTINMNNANKGAYTGKLSVSAGSKSMKEIPHSLSECRSLVNNTGNQRKVSGSKVESASQSVHQIKGFIESKAFSSAPNSVEKPPNSNDVISEKRKWALEVLARKTGKMPSAIDQKKTEASLGEKGNFPLLIQLPSDMRPILPHNRHSKVPTSVRQIQLNRLVEHYLKKANLETIRRTAESEFAVADAVIKETEIYEKSNSKSVYTNLCAQALSQQVSSHKLMGDNDDYHNSGTESSDDVTAALMAAGLISDSPPESPYQTTENSDGEHANAVENKDGGIDVVENVLDLDCHPALDIYGDFEYDLEDLDIPGPMNIPNGSRISMVQTEDSVSKVKVILSTGHRVKHSEDQEFEGENNEDLCAEQVAAGASNPLQSSREFSTESIEGINTFPTLNAVQVIPDIEGSATLDTPMDKYTASSLHAEKDIEPEVTKMLNVDLDQSRGCILQPKLDGHSTNLINSQGQAFADNHKAYEMKMLTSSGSFSMKQRTGSFPARHSDLISNQDDEVVEGSSSVKLHYTESKVDEKRLIPDHFVDPAISKADQRNHNTEVKEKFPVSIEPGSDASNKESERGSNNQQPDISHSIWKKVETYIKEHIRPLCKSGVVTAEQYRWAVGKTVDKVMKYHCKAKNADFLISEGNKVKKLAEQYLQAFKQKEPR